MPAPETAWVVLALSAVLLVVAVGLLLAAGGRRRARRPRPRAAETEPFAAAPEDRPLAAVVVNPTKLVDPDPTRGMVQRVCRELGWADPLWLETTPQDPGAGQARQALEQGADVVVACGGDGTVRSVAETMANSGTAMGLLPAGTGNLLARNLAVDLTDVEASLRAALSGDDRRLDVGWVAVTTPAGSAGDAAAPDGGPPAGRDAAGDADLPAPAADPALGDGSHPGGAGAGSDAGPGDRATGDAADEADGGGEPAGGSDAAGETGDAPGGAGEPPEAEVEGPERLFLVMAGMGFDAAMMADVPEALKARVGPLAYFVSGLRHLRGRQARVTLVVDDGEPMQRRVSTVVVGNVGTLLGGLTLMPDAEVDDGWLDGVTIAPRGIVGWAGVALRVLTRRRKGHHRVEHWRGRTVLITADRPEEAQLDGDPIGRALGLRVRVDPGALLLRVPPGTPARAWPRG